MTDSSLNGCTLSAPSDSTESVDVRIARLQQERDAALALLDDAEKKLERLAETYGTQLASLREDRNSLRKGAGTLTKRVEEVMNERDGVRSKIVQIREVFQVWVRRECTAWDMAKELEKIDP